MMQLATEANLPERAAGELIEKMRSVASQFTSIAQNLHHGVITQDTLKEIQGRIDANLTNLR